MKEKKVLYILIAALNYLLGSTWVLALYNDPSLSTMKTTREWVIVGLLTFLFTAQASLIAWKAYTSNPNVANGDTPAPVPPVQKPAGTTDTAQ
jgi:hypothetical protein